MIIKVTKVNEMMIVILKMIIHGCVSLASATKCRTWAWVVMPMLFTSSAMHAHAQHELALSFFKHSDFAPRASSRKHASILVLLLELLHATMQLHEHLLLLCCACFHVSHMLTARHSLEIFHVLRLRMCCVHLQARMQHSYRRTAL